MNITHAIVLSAGLGTRMRPLTNSIPKPLIPVAGKPLIDWCLDWLADAGIAEVVVNTSYRAAQLEDYLAARNNPTIHFSREEPSPLETGGGIAKALSMLGNTPFVAMNSDAIFSAQPLHPVTQLMQAWHDDLDFVMLLVHKKNTIGWEGKGDFILADDGRIRRPVDNEDAPYVFTGVEIIHPRVFAGCPSGAFSLSALWKKNADPEGWYARIRAVVYDGDWLNVGDLAGLTAAEDYCGGAADGNRK